MIFEEVVRCAIVEKLISASRRDRKSVTPFETMRKIEADTISGLEKVQQLLLITARVPSVPDSGQLRSRNL